MIVVMRNQILPRIVPDKVKNEPTRFLGEGVSFKAKLIGILEVSEARGDRMCQAALADLKMAIRAAGEHKQRIAVQVSIEGLRLRDEKTGDCLYHHPVHKISFIAQDMSDSRAFGYIFGSPDTGHRFFGIKTDKAASQVVLAMRDLFQVVFDLKKKEIELAKQHLEQNAIKFRSGIFVEPAPDTKGAAGSEVVAHRIRALNSEVEKPIERKTEVQGGVIADLLDLQFELNSLQQGIHQMDKITPDNPRPPSEDPFETDPFGDSFANMKLSEMAQVKENVQPMLPPPPSSAKRGHLERHQTIPTTTASSTSSPATTLTSKTPPPQGSVHWFDKETENLFNEGELSSLAMKAANPSTGEKERECSSSSCVTPTLRKSPQIDVFTELDPLGTGLIKPYVDKKDFFQHLKNPPKKVLKDLVTNITGDTFSANFNLTFDPLEPTVQSQTAPLASAGSDGFDDDNFADFNKFDNIEIPPQKTESPRIRRVSSPRILHHQPLSVSLPPEETPLPKNAGNISSLNKTERESTENVQGLVRLPSPKKYLQSVRKREFDIDLAGSRTQSLDRPFPVDFTTNNDSPASPLRSGSSDANSRLSSSSAEMDIVPEPPPRGAGSILINPPPLPPKKQIGGRNVMKPPPRPPHSDGHFHYDFIEREEASPSPTRKEIRKSPAKDFRNRFDDDFSPPPPQLPKRSELVATFPTSKFEDSFTSITPTTLSSLLQSNTTSSTTAPEVRKPKPSLDITLSQLNSTNLGDLANSLGMTITELTSLTLQQLTACLASLTAKETTCNGENENEKEPEIPAKPNNTTKKIVQETSFVFGEPLFKADFDQGIEKTSEQNSYDKYAVFRELLELEQREQDDKDDEVNKEKSGKQQPEMGKVEPEVKESEIQEETKESNDTVEIEIVNATENNNSLPLANLTVSLPPLLKDSSKIISDSAAEDPEERTDGSPESVQEEEKTDSQESKGEDEEIGIEEQRLKDAEPELEDTNKLEEEREKEKESETQDDEKGVDNERDGDSNELEKSDESGEKEESKNGNGTTEKVEIKSSTSTSDRYAALREIIEESVEPTLIKTKEEIVENLPPPPQLPPKNNNAAIDLMSLFAKPLPNTVQPPASGSPKNLKTTNDEDMKVLAMEIFEEIKMLNTGAPRKNATPDPALPKSTPPVTGFEDTFSPFPVETKTEKDEVKDDAGWAKFDANVFHSDKSSGDGPGSVGGTSPWSPDGKEFHAKEPPFKPVPNRNSGDSDNEWKDEEESEGSNGRPRDDGFWGPGGKPPPRHQAGFEDPRSYYDHGSPTGPSDKDRSFRERSGRKARGSPWGKGGHRSRDPSPWQEDQGRWEDEHRGRYPARKIPYKDQDEESYKAHWKCRQKPSCKQRTWSGDREGFWAHDMPSYEEERKRRMMLWSEQDRDRFSSQESMGYEDEERWSRRWSNEYERRRWEEDGRFWGRRGPEGDYPYREPREPREPRDSRDPRDPRESYRIHDSHYCRERSHDYAPPGWEEPGWDYIGPDIGLGENSPRYNSSRKRPWPKRPNSATDSRNSEGIYADPRPKYAVSRSECSDNDSDPYHRPHRSGSRESYWGSDQEFEGWVERPCWSEGPDSVTKTETLHRRRINRHKPRAQIKSQSSPFEDDFNQSLEHVGESTPDPFVSSGEARLTSEPDPKLIEPVTLSPRCTKEGLRREPRSYKRSGYRHSPFEEDLTPTASVSSDTSDRQRLGSDLKATPEELPRDAKDALSADGFVSEDSGRDSFFNGDPRFDDDAFAFKSELEDSVPERATTLPLKNSRQMKCGSGKSKSDLQYIKKSESVNIFVRESDPFDDDDFFN